MNYERERVASEKRALQALDSGNWGQVAYNLFSASRMSLRMAQTAEGRTRRSLVKLAQRYQYRGAQALARCVPDADGQSDLTQEPVQESDKSRKWLMTERPDLRLDDVAGMEEVKKQIERHILLPMKHADVFREYRLNPGTGLLLYGPPGTGKTHIARAIAGQTEAAFIPVKLREVLSKWFGESERLLTELFEEAAKHPRTVLFFDEAEALFPKRSNTNSSVMARIVPQLLQLIEGIDGSKNTLILMGATNRPWLMDEAALRPGRFGRAVYVGPPDLDARRYMVQRAMRNVPTLEIDFDQIAATTEGYSGADIAGERDSLVVEARMAALDRTLAKRRDTAQATNSEPVTMEDFAAAMDQVRPSIQATDLKRYERFHNDMH